MDQYTVYCFEMLIKYQWILIKKLNLPFIKITMNDYKIKESKS